MDRNKERLRIRFGIEVRKDEMERRKEEIEVEQGQGSMNMRPDHLDYRALRPSGDWAVVGPDMSHMIP